MPAFRLCSRTRLATIGAGGRTMKRLVCAFGFLSLLAIPVVGAAAADSPPPAQRSIQKNAPPEQKAIQRVPNRATPVLPAMNAAQSATREDVTREAQIRRTQPTGPPEKAASKDVTKWPAWYSIAVILVNVTVVGISVVRARTYLSSIRRPPRKFTIVRAIFPYTVFQLFIFALFSGLIAVTAIFTFELLSFSILGDGNRFFRADLIIYFTAFIVWYFAEHYPRWNRLNQRLLARLAFGSADADPRAKILKTAAGSQTLGEMEDAVRSRRSIADRLVSDRPLREGDPDPLGYGALARGISRFLRNRQTQTPLTLAVTGAWGTGKSSIMSLLQSDLAREGFRPVWFNAWHHQQEAHLLAALLETMRVGAFPAWWTPGGIAFRLRLFWLRAKRRPGIFILIGALLALQAGFVLSGAAPAVSDLIALFESDAKKGDAAAGALTALPGIGAVLAVLLTMRTRFSNTFLDPARLTATVGRLAAVGRFRDRLSFRHRFGREFRDVVEALSPRKLVILVDDLDRCRPESVLEVLESVNFLVASGECIVIMGLDRDRVVDSIAYSFKDVTTFLADSGGAPQNAADHQHAFAENYLEKLVNVEVAVPALPPDAAVRLLREENVEDEKGKKPEKAGWHRVIAKVGTPLYAGTVILILGGIAFGIGRLLTGGMEIADGGTTAGPTNNSAATPGEPWLTWVLGIFAAGLILWEARKYFGGRREERLLASGEILEDSNEFTDALEDWYPLMATRLRTPRALKRFINRLRFLAMMARDGDDAAADEIDEATFVGLAVVERCEPDVFTMLSDAASHAAPIVGSDEYSDASENHAKRHGDASWPPAPEVAARFRGVSEGIVTRDEEPPEEKDMPAPPIPEETSNAAE